MVVYAFYWAPIWLESAVPTLIWREAVGRPINRSEREGEWGCKHEIHKTHTYTHTQAHTQALMVCII